MTIAQLVRLPAVARQLEITLALADVAMAIALSKEIGCKPHEALYALEPNNEPMEG